MPCIRAVYRRIADRPSRCLFLGYWLILALGTHWPRWSVWPGPGSDKVLHVGAYFGLGLIGCIAAPRIFSTGTRYGFVAIAIAFYATIDELTQGAIPGRTPDIADWVADLAGSALGIAAAAAWYLYRTREDATRSVASESQSVQRAAPAP